jgi:hypothetical protein
VIDRDTAMPTITMDYRVYRNGRLLLLFNTTTNQPLPQPRTPQHRLTIMKHRVFTADEVLRIGLLCAGFDSSRQLRVQRTTNVQRFQSFYGSSPLVCSAIWEDLFIGLPKSASFDKFFMALYFLKEYPTEEKLAGMWHTCEKSARQWVWFFVEKIQALKTKKVRYNISAVM